MRKSILLRVAVFVVICAVSILTASQTFGTGADSGATQPIASAQGTQYAPEWAVTGIVLAGTAIFLLRPRRRAIVAPPR